MVKDEKTMIIDKLLLDNVTAQAKASPRRKRPNLGPSRIWLR